jgi:hypothetical protein
MTGETICELLKLLIGKSGPISLLVSGISQISFGAAE